MNGPAQPTASGRRRDGWVLAALGAALLAVLGYSFDATLELQEDPLRLVLGGLTVFLVPGLIAGEVLRIRCRHALLAVAIGFLLTQAVEIVLLAVCLTFQFRIAMFVYLLLGASFVGLCVLAYRLDCGRRFVFLRSFHTFPPGTWSDRLVYVVACGAPVVLSVFAYRWGEDLTDVAGEKLLHLLFARNYFSLPLAVNDLGVAAGYGPPNLVNFWEFLIAAAARSVQTDPLPVFYRSRFLIPLLGLSGVFLLVRSIFVRPRKTHAVFLAVCLFAGMRLFLAATDLAGVIAFDSTRSAFAFAGTAHHADAAMGVLLALGTGVMILAVRKPSRGNLALFAVSQTTCFLWHPREYLQIALSLGVLGAVFLAAPMLRTRRAFRNWAATTGVLFGLSAVLLATSSLLVGKGSHGYDEMAIKRAFVANALTPEIGSGVRNFFHIPRHLIPSPMFSPGEVLTWQEMSTLQIDESWQLDQWLMLCAVGVCILGWFGDRRDQHLAVYVVVFWFLALCWNFSMLAIGALTYSEFFMSTPRLLYIPAYLVLAAAICVVARRAREVWLSLLKRGRVPGRRWIADFGTVAVLWLAGAATFSWWFRREVFGMQPAWTLPEYDPKLSAPLLSWLMVLTVARVFWRREADRIESPPGGGVAFAGVAAFFLPLLHVEPLQLALSESRASEAYIVQRAQPAWFADDNPFGMSTEFIGWVRSQPPQKTWLVHPGGIESQERMNLLSVYAPQYSLILPAPRLIKDAKERERIDADCHPLLYPVAGALAVASAPAIDHRRAVDWLQTSGVDYVVVDREYYDTGLHLYFLKHPQQYEVVYHKRASREFVVRCRWNDGPTGATATATAAENATSGATAAVLPERGGVR